jgi:hypothetical protein
MIEDRDERIAALLGKKNIAAEQERVNLERMGKPEAVRDVTVREPAGLKMEAPAPEPTPAPLRMNKGDVILPDGIGNIPPMVKGRFIAWWVKLVFEMFPGESRQPTLTDFREWRAMDEKKPHEPSPLAKLIDISETVEEFQDRPRVPEYTEQPQTPPGQSPRGLGNEFGTGATRNFGRA